jgi:hypothetical protein
MRLQKMKKAAALAIAASALTACASTTAPSVTPIKTIRTAEMPSAPHELLAKHERPERPAGGSPQQLLNHAVAYGAYTQKLETQIGGWQTWYEKGRLNHE